jgi:hypothetical protein
MGDSVGMDKLSIAIILTLLVTAPACGEDTPSSSSDTLVDASDPSDVPIDSATEPDTSLQDTAEDATEDIAPNDTASPNPCVALCAPHEECGEDIFNACLGSCDLTEAGICEQACVAEAETCEETAQCLGVKETLAAFSEGPYGNNPRELAGPFQLQTLGRPIDFEATWNGRESYVFLMKQTGWEYAESMWESDIFGWLRDSPDNVHYVMMGYPYQDANGSLVDDVAAIVTDLKDRAEEKLVKIGAAYGKARECHWRRHLHFVPTQAWGVGGWIQEKLEAKGVLGFAIDRFQAIRAVGLMSMVNQNPVFGHARYEAEYYNFEWEREKNLRTEGVTEIVLFQDENIGGTTVDVELPSAEEMEAFDTFEIDLGSYCKDHDEANCGEWDYKASLKLKEYPELDENPNAATACQAAVAAKEAVEGTCPDDTPCATSADCADEGVCEGAETEIAGIDADTLPCQCVGAGGSPRESTQTCAEGGEGYGDCTCNQTIEIARWITTYGREGRWVSDQTQMLPLLKKGGKHRFHYSPGNAYFTNLSFRFYNADKVGRPTQLVPLFGGGSFNPSYNAKYEPLTVEIPADTKRVEVFAYITGHGWGAEKENCAEFCNHTHHFTVGDKEYMHEQPWVGNNYGCAAQVPMGTVPNQYGTWTLGRAGWCPGLDVKPFVADVTESITPGESVTVTYKGLFEGADYQPEPSGSGQGFGANVTMSSWLVLHQ